MVALERSAAAAAASGTGTTFAKAVCMRCIADFGSDQRGNVAFSYLIVTFVMILIGSAVVGLAVPLAIENKQAERMLIENNP